MGQVECAQCGETADIADPADPAVEVRWKCPNCSAANLVDGHPGEPGEGALNPAASALTDDELLEAAQRRGILRRLDVGGSAGPEGETNT